MEQLWVSPPPNAIIFLVPELQGSDLRFFQTSLINDKKGAFFPPHSMPENFHIGFQRDLLFPEWGNKTISIQNTARRLHLPQPNF